MPIKIDAEENPELANAFRSTSIPIVSVLIDGRIADRFLAAMPESGFRQWLHRIV